MSESNPDTSKFLSYILRHEPQSIGIELDSEGWVDVAVLVAAAQGAGKVMDLELIQKVVSESSKKRFALSEDGLRIRAVQGHTTSTVALQHVAVAPPEFLYHGTATRFLDSIMASGLLAGQRHHVHLSADIATATEVGRRHGKPVVLRINARRMHAQGVEFFQAENGVWLTAHVPAIELSLASY